MTREEMIAAVEQEVARLEQIRSLLAGSHSERFALPEVAPSSPGEGARKRVMSEDARRRIALAQKRRWAKQKKEAAAGAEAK